MTNPSAATSRCRSCGRHDGHDLNCRAVATQATTRLQATCDHRPEYGATQTTGDPPGPRRCGRCEAKLDPVVEFETVETSMDIVITNTGQFERWGDRPERYNASAEPCDMWTGPCACGAWHYKGA